MIHRVKSIANILVSDYLAAKRIRKVAKQKHNNTVIKVGFIVQVPEIWDKEVDIFEEMNCRDNFETILLVVAPFDFKNWTCKADYKDNYFLKKYDNTLKVICSDDSVIDLEALKLDYIFYQRPYNQYLPESIRPFEVSKYSKCCFVPYGYAAADNFLDIATSRDFFNSIYFSFFDSSYYQIHCKRKYPISSLFVHHFLNLGYPCLEQFLHFSPNQKIKNVMWTPRWNFNSEIIASNFLKYKDWFVQFSLMHKEVSFIFRPHPLLFDEVEKEQLMTRREIEEYKSSLYINGIEYDSGTLVTDSINKTDLLITDFSSMVINYFLTGKPIIYCYSDAKYSKEFFEILECCYVADNSQDIDRYLNELFNGNDYLKEKRLALIKKNFTKHQGASKRIVDEIEKDFKKE